MEQTVRPWPKNKTISVVVDTVGWFDEFAKNLVKELIQAGHNTRYSENYADVIEGDIGFYLSCMKITPPELLEKHTWNLVVHASDLPKGRGFSPMVWQILEGKSVIPVTMITMSDDVDSGDIVAQDKLFFEGHELNSEMREVLGKTIVEMCVNLANSKEAPALTAQSGESTWYDRRYPKDSMLDPNLTIVDSFNKLRVVDNEKYPAYFEHLGFRYALRIKKIGPTSSNE